MYKHMCIGVKCTFHNTKYGKLFGEKCTKIEELISMYNLRYIKHQINACVLECEVNGNFFFQK